MIDKMTEIFYGEANDLLDKLEDLLLELEENPTDSETIQAVFRSMHTIKGSSSMFGFDSISHFTHEVETAFDEVRNNRVAVSNELITLTLQARDHIRDLLSNGDSPETEAESGRLIVLIQENVRKNSIGGPKAQPKTAAPQQAVAEQKKNAKVSSELVWRIKFSPARDIFMNGTKPLALIAELAALGKASITVFPSKVPPLSEMDPASCYFFWEIILTTTESLDAIKDVFIFLDSSHTVEITSISDADELLEQPVKKIGEILIEKNVVSVHEIENVLQNKKPIGQILTEQKIVSEENIQSALAEQQHVKEVQEKRQQESNAQTIKVNSDKLDKLIDLVGELVTFNARLGQVSQNMQNSTLSTISEQGERLILELRDTTMDMRMLPIGTIFSRFRRLVRDLAADLHKNIELATEGADTELDKTVIEKLNDPLVHLIRNSVDHGVETADIREKSGKSPVGKVLLKAQHAGAFVLITIEDDGAGLNLDRIRQKALEKGLISQADELTDQQIGELIFLPGFSTAQNVTSVSGRGVGMDVVKKDITALGGTVSVNTKAGKGTQFVLKLPLTLAIIEGILVKIGKNFFVIPLSNVVECLAFTRPANSKLCSSINIRNTVVPYVDLRTFFSINDPLPAAEQIVIVTDQDSRIGLIIDKVIGNYQTVIKPLGRLYKNVSGLSGATILGDGSVGLILDIYKLSDVIKQIDNQNQSTL